MLGSFQSQSAQIDSLELQLQTTTDTNKVKVLCDLCWEYRYASPEKALELANQLGFEKGIAQSYNDMGIIYIDKGNYKKAVDFLTNQCLSGMRCVIAQLWQCYITKSPSNPSKVYILPSLFNKWPVG